MTAPTANADSIGARLFRGLTATEPGRTCLQLMLAGIVDQQEAAHVARIIVDDPGLFDPITVARAGNILNPASATTR